MAEILNTVLVGDCRETLKAIPDGAVDCVCTSPPYWGLRAYLPDGHPDKDREIGSEKTPQEYVENMVILFREVRRCLADHGSAWINLGDSYNGIGGPGKQNGGPIGKSAGVAVSNTTGRRISGLKAKDLVGIPWKVAFALQADGWWLRGDHIWAKPNGMPESVTDRPSRGHEYVFLLTKSDRYWYDSYAVRTAPKSSTVTRLMQDVGGQAGSVRANGGRKTNGTMKAVAKQTDKQRGHSRRHAGFNDRWDSMSRDEQMEMGVNLRSVWWIPPAQCRYAHFAVMPKRVAEICILAGCPESVCETCGTPWVRDLERERKPTRPGRDTKVKGDSATEGNRDPQRHVTQYTDKGFVRACKCDPLLTRRGIVLDPFMGSGTTAQVAQELGRDYIGCELNAEYHKLIDRRTQQPQLF